MPNPLILLIGTLFLMAWGVTLEKSVNERRFLIGQARTAYVQALTDTRTQLAGLVSKVVSDPTLQQNMQWKLNHSINRRLKIKVQKGGMDQIYIWNDKCEIHASANLGEGIKGACPYADNRFTTGKFLWSVDGQVPVLSLVNVMSKKGKGNKPYYAMGMVSLDSNWLALFPKLNKLSKQLELSIGPATNVKGTIIHNEGQSTTGESLASLGTSRFLDRFIGAEHLSETAYENPFFWPGFVLALIFAFMHWFKQRAWRLQMLGKQAEFLEWCKSLSPIADFDMPGKANGEKKDLTIDLKDGQKYVSQAIQTKVDTIRKGERKRQELESSIKKLETEISAYQQRLGELAELDSLAIQLQRTTSSFLDKMEDLHSRSEDLSDVLGGPVAEQCQTMVAMLGDWNHGIEERGARKFIRSLYETPSEEDDRSLLEIQTESLFHLMEGVRDGAVSASIAANDMVEISGYAARIASLWHGLSMRSDEDNFVDNLADVIEESQELVTLEYGEGLIFKNLGVDLDMESSEGMPNIPKTIWTSALYHIYLGFAELSKGRQDTFVVTRKRVEAVRSLLVVSLMSHKKLAPKGGATTAQPDHRPNHTEKQAYHLEVARAMLAPYEIKIMVLPALDDAFPIALAWENNSLTGTTGVKLLPNSELSGALDDREDQLG
jgi:hypothetical protein